MHGATPPSGASPDLDALVRPLPRPGADVRLFCFPYAGGGARAYTPWARELPGEVELVALRPPGRETRIGEPPYRSLGPLVSELAEVVRPWTADKPYLLYGHSMGALVAYELTRRFRDAGIASPAKLVVSGRRAPHAGREVERLHDLPDDDLVDALDRLGGTPDAVLDNREVMSLLLPTIRADLAVVEGYDHVPGPPLSVPVSAYGGRDDPWVDAASLAAWARHTVGPFRAVQVPGAHFFLAGAADVFLSALSAEIRELGFVSWGGTPP